MKDYKLLSYKLTHRDSAFTMKQILVKNVGISGGNRGDEVVKLTLKQVNEMNQEAFILAFGPLFEHSPWVAERAWGSRPFAKITGLISALEQEVERASREEQLALLRAHPDLGTRVRMTDHSVQEQSGAGLNQLTPEEYEQFLSLNKQYTDAFQFPFIMAVKGQTKDTIREALRFRIEGELEVELGKALQEVCKIGRFRLADIVMNETEEKAMEQRKAQKESCTTGKVMYGSIVPMPSR